MKKYIIELTDEEFKELQKDLGLTDEEIKVMPEEDLARHIMSYKCRKTCRKLVKRDAEGYVSEELEYASEKYACRFSSSKYGHDKVKDAFIAGADWQKEQFEKERLKHCDELTTEQAKIESDFVTNHLKKHSRTPTFIDAIEYGMRLQKEQMMEKAIDELYIIRKKECGVGFK